MGGASSSTIPMTGSVGGGASGIAIARGVALGVGVGVVVSIAKRMVWIGGLGLAIALSSLGFAQSAVWVVGIGFAGALGLGVHQRGRASIVLALVVGLVSWFEALH